jgi:hypothetical protein
MSSSQVAPPASPVRIVVARATEASNRDGFGVAAISEVDLVDSGGLDLPGPPDADLRRAVRMHPDLPERRAAQALADGSVDAVWSLGDPVLAAAALSFTLGPQRGVTAPTLAAVFTRPGLSRLVVAPSSAAVLAAALVECLDGPTGVAHLTGSAVSGAFTTAMDDPQMGLALGADEFIAGLLTGWQAAGGTSPDYVVLGVPAVAVIGPSSSAIWLIRALLDNNLVGYATKALAALVGARRHAAGLGAE